MAKLTAAKRDKIPASGFALPGGRYPIADKSHARNALARISQYGSAEEKARVRRKVHAKFPSIGVAGGATSSGTKKFGKTAPKFAFGKR